jgi:hypothetical protein
VLDEYQKQLKIIKSLEGCKIKSAKLDPHDQNCVLLTVQNKKSENQVKIGAGCMGLYLSSKNSVDGFPVYDDFDKLASEIRYECIIYLVEEDDNVIFIGEGKDNYVFVCTANDKLIWKVNKNKVINSDLGKKYKIGTKEEDLLGLAKDLSVFNFKKQENV